MANRDVVKRFDEVLEKAQEIYLLAIKRGLQMLGEECINRIRRDHPDNWLDQTGNLRSSIGYGVIDHGKVTIKSAFQSVSGFSGDGKKGSAIGEEYLMSLAKLYSDTYSLVVVAGMDYAEYVEARGRDVLASTELWAKKEVEDVIMTALRSAEKQIERMMQ